MNPLYRSLIKPIRDENISAVLSSVSPNEFSPYDKELNFEERIIPIRRFVKDFKKWAKYIKGLDEFNYTYVTNGNTDALNILFTQEKSLAFDKEDYRYYGIINNVLNKDLTSLDSAENILFTWPSYNDGTNYFLDRYKDSLAKKHLDVAYLGLTVPVTCNVQEFETVNISFSKTLSMPYNRLGLTFSKNPIPLLETMNKIGYVNLSGLKIAQRLILSFDIDYWMRTYWDRYITLCKDHNLQSTNCILFAYDNLTRIGVTELYDRNF